MGVEGRYDLTPKWDVGLAASVLHSWQSDAFDYSSGVSIGHHVVKNAWLSIGYNFLGFKDEDFSETNYTAQGPFIQFRFKFDQNSVQEALGRLETAHQSKDVNYINRLRVFIYNVQKQIDGILNGGNPPQNPAAV